jgi:hypothetical protein
VNSFRHLGQGGGDLGPPAHFLAGRDRRPQERHRGTPPSGRSAYPRECLVEVTRRFDQVENRFLDPSPRR